MRRSGANEMTQVCLIGSPLNGWLQTLATVPDPVFAQGMAGDGVAINPTDPVLCAPCAGTVQCNARTPHAIGMRTDDGFELLMHIGIDTVMLEGRGFRVLVADGESVTAGQPLIEFDLDLIARQAASAITPVLLVSANARIVRRRENTAVAVGDTLFELERIADAENSDAPAGQALKRKITVAFEQGMHARPAAAFTAVLRPFQAQVRVLLENKPADARSMVAMMSLGIKHLDVIELRVTGPDAEAAMAAAAAFFELEAAQHGAEPARPTITKQSEPRNGIIKGVVASRGLAVGKAFHLKRHALAVQEEGGGVEQELAALQAAIDRLKTHLTAQLGDGTDERHDILNAHIALLQDPVLFEQSVRLIRQGKSAGHSWRYATADVVSALNAMDNAYMKERIADFHDIEQGMLRALSGQDLSARQALPDRSILIVDELLPSQLMALDIPQIAGICSSGGGPSAHAAIIAASLRIPFLVAAGHWVHDIKEGDALILDAENGYLQVEVDNATLSAAAQRIERRQAQADADLASALLPALTIDQTAVKVYANLGGSSEVCNALASGAQGCGLFRTEFLFMDRQSAPGEDEQLRVYGDILGQMPDKPVTIRTMDIGGDKPIAYLPLPKEENPALGLRGLRTSLWRDQLFIDQLRAILRLPQPNQVRILLPMVNDVADIELARRYIDQCAEGLGLTQLPEIGAMIETPASALLLDQLLEVVDFVSIGSNDLSQYVLAIDRGHPELASKLDALHPAVLRMIAQVAETGRLAGKNVSLCGGLASDPVAIPVLLGLGVIELSVVPALIPRVKSLIRQLHLQACRVLAENALQAKDAASIRRMAAEFIAQAELGAQA